MSTVVTTPCSRRTLAVIALAISVLLACSGYGQSPYALSGKRDGVVGASALALGISAWMVQDAVAPLTLDQVAAHARADLNPLDRGATYLYSDEDAILSDWLLYTLIAAPVAMLADHRVRDDWQTFLLMYAETLALNGGAGQLVKGLTQRSRPYVYNPEVPEDHKTDVKARKSFYSSHTSFAFSSAVFLMTTLSGYAGDARYVPYVAAAALCGASAVGILRYASGRHFPTDILVGALVGSLIGWSIPAIHRTSGGAANPSIALALSIPV